MLPLLSLLACAGPADPANVDGDAIEKGADDPVWDPRTLPIYWLTLPDDWKAQLTAAIPSEDEYCLDRTTILGRLDYDNPQSGGTDHFNDVAVRFRGHSTLQGSERLGFKLLFDTLDPDARFYNEKHINLLGVDGDESLLSERLALGLMDAQGVPAGRVIHSRVFVNDEFLGIFPVSQEPDDQPFVDDHFVKESGHLYKVEGYCGGTADFAYEGEDYDEYDKKYVAKAGTLATDVTTDLVPLLNCVAGNDAALQTCLPTHIQLEEWLAEMAVDAVLPDIDGLAGAGQNFLMYNDPVTGTFVAYSYDKDQAFNTDTLESDSIFDFHPEWASPPELTTRMRAIWKSEYCAQVTSVIDDYAKIPAQIDDLVDFLSPYMATDPILTVDAWTGEAGQIQTTITNRVSGLRDQAERCAP